MARKIRRELVELDGRTLEGGGQLLRIALCLSALIGIPIKITDIRGNRSGGGGLKAQHLACVKWLAHACNAKVEGAERGSKTLLFEPGKIESGLSPAFTKKRLASGEQICEARLDIGTAGSTGLALQAILPYILFSEFPSDGDISVRLTLSGGTNVSGSPSYEYITQVLLPTLRNIGFPDIQARLEKRGWSHGGSSIGILTLEIPARRSRVLPAFKLAPSNIADGQKLNELNHIHATFIAPASCHEHLRKVLPPAVQHHFGDACTIQNGNLSIDCEGSLHEKRMYIILVATIPSDSDTGASPSSYKLGRDWLYDRKIRTHERAASEIAERVAKDLADEWRSGGYVDEHMRDQLAIFQALAEGKSLVYPGQDGEDDEQLREPSLHARTAEWVARQMLDVRFDTEGACQGVGFGKGTTRTVQGAQSKDAEGLSEGVETLDVG